MIVIVDYDTGNTLNVKKALDYLAIDNQLSADPAVILAAAGLILPGVGAFKTAMSALTQRDLVPVIRQFATTGKPLLGICLGMQLLFDRSFEFGETAGMASSLARWSQFHHERDSRHRTWGGTPIRSLNPILLQPDLPTRRLTLSTRITSRPNPPTLWQPPTTVNR